MPHKKGKKSNKNTQSNNNKSKQNNLSIGESSKKSRDTAKNGNNYNSDKKLREKKLQALVGDYLDPLDISLDEYDSPFRIKAEDFLIPKNKLPKPVLSSSKEASFNNDKTKEKNKTRERDTKSLSKPDNKKVQSSPTSTATNVAETSGDSEALGSVKNSNKKHVEAAKLSRGAKNVNKQPVSKFSEDIGSETSKTLDVTKESNSASSMIKNNKLAASKSTNDATSNNRSETSKNLGDSTNTNNTEVSESVSANNNNNIREDTSSPPVKPSKSKEKAKKIETDEYTLENEETLTQLINIDDDRFKNSEGYDELLTNTLEEGKYVFPSNPEIKKEQMIAPDLQIVQQRIADAVRVLDDFKELGNQDRERTEYVDRLVKDIATYYGYSEFLAEKLFHLFPVSEALDFFEANEVPRPVTIRTNTLRTQRRDLAQKLIDQGVTLEPIEQWSKVGLTIFSSDKPLGATPEYLAGDYMIQSAASLLSVMALAPQKNEKILDMAAAPGGKSTYIAALMNNTGQIFSNDTNKERTKALTANIHRMGVKNTVVSNFDGREYPKVMNGFDRVLLDAPCSGTGIISKDALVKIKTDKDFMQLSQLQSQLIISAIDSVDAKSSTGGYIVYSTCSVTVEENEAVVNYALNKRPNVKLVPTEIDFGVEGFTKFCGKIFHSSMNLTKRFYPHMHNVDGFFVAKFKKFSNTIPKVEVDNEKSKGIQHQDILLEERNTAEMKMKCSKTKV
ncbi:7107_t:CDS:2 [Ambispora gerdemannii]|uniref:Nucleolar protein 2 n=1 Tax=Ambispora gerdemannii TaxID=144530 RepID=A0A9N9CBL0_9GLOM|nr:7107_t:CDS:2 [Ambispora gerdemannii]